MRAPHLPRVALALARCPMVVAGCDVGVWNEQRLIVPGEPSVLRMPPMLTDVVHTEATALVAEWTESISTCP